MLQSLSRQSAAQPVIHYVTKAHPMEQHDAEWADARYAYSASEGAICHDTIVQR